jgi:hypothetical protein
MPQLRIRDLFVAEVISVAVRGGAAVAAGAGAVLPALRRGALAPGPGLPNAGGRVLAGAGRGEVGGVKGRHSFSHRPPFTRAEGGGAKKNARGQGRGATTFGERSSPRLELRKALFWPRQWGPLHLAYQQIPLSERELLVLRREEVACCHCHAPLPPNHSLSISRRPIMRPARPACQRQPALRSGRYAARRCGVERVIAALRRLSFPRSCGILPYRYFSHRARAPARARPGCAPPRACHVQPLYHSKFVRATAPPPNCG